MFINRFRFLAKKSSLTLLPQINSKFQGNSSKTHNIWPCRHQIKSAQNYKAYTPASKFLATKRSLFYNYKNDWKGSIKALFTEIKFAGNEEISIMFKTIVLKRLRLSTSFRFLLDIFKTFIWILRRVLNPIVLVKLIVEIYRQIKMII